MNGHTPTDAHVALRLGVRSWFYVKQGEGALRPVEASVVHGFLLGADVWQGPLLDGVVHLASIILVVKNWGPIRVVTESFVKLAVLEDGHIDHDHRLEGARTEMCLMRQRTVPSDRGDRFAQRRLEARHRWRPSDRDRAALTALLLRYGIRP